MAPWAALPNRLGGRACEGELCSSLPGSLVEVRVQRPLHPPVASARCIPLPRPRRQHQGFDLPLSLFSENTKKKQRKRENPNPEIHRAIPLHPPLHATVCPLHRPLHPVASARCIPLHPVASGARGVLGSAPSRSSQPLRPPRTRHLPAQAQAQAAIPQGPRGRSRSRRRRPESGGAPRVARPPR